MTALFADTFYWIALADFTDSGHQRALALTAARASSQIVTTDEVLAECLTFFATLPSRCAAKPLLRSRVFSKIWGPRCTTEPMRREGLTEVLTNDRHFEREGFRALLRVS